MDLDQALAKIAELEGVIKEKDEILMTKDTEIGRLTNVNREQAGNFKKLRDMTQAEKDLYTEKELELMRRTEEVEEKSKKVEEEQKSFQQKQKDTIIENLANKMARGDKEIAAQIKINLGKLNPELINPAMTEAELTPHVETAFNMLGIQAKGDPLRDAHNAGGMNAPVDNANDFSNTEEGKATASALGLASSKIDTNNDNK